MKRTRSTYLALLAVLLSPLGVSADPVVWHLQNVTFEDGGIATGSFTYDADIDCLNTLASCITDWSIVTSGGNVSQFSSPFSYDSALANHRTQVLPTGADFQVLMFYSDTVVNHRSRGLRIDPLSPLTNAGGTIELDLANIDFNVECFGCSPYRLITSGSVTSIPEPTSCEMSASEFADSVEVIPAGETMRAFFSPSNGCTLDEVAEAMGYTHFNWTQVITHYDGFLFYYNGARLDESLPMFDPPYIGYLDQPADLNRWYWDEGDSPVCFFTFCYVLNPVYHLDNNTPLPTLLNFDDTPRSVQIDTPEEYMGFTTSLVGVIYRDENRVAWKPEFTFKWKSNYNGDSGGTTGRDKSPPNGGEGGVFDVQILDDPFAVDADTQKLWISNGGFKSIPRTVDIDVKPESTDNCVNINGKGVIPVAVLGSAEFDVSHLSLHSILFGGLSTRKQGNGEPICSSEDVNSDGYIDVQCQFEDIKGNWASTGGTALLRGELTDGSEFAGWDTICAVP